MQLDNKPRLIRLCRECAGTQDFNDKNVVVNTAPCSSDFDCEICRKPKTAGEIFWAAIAPRTNGFVEYDPDDIPKFFIMDIPKTPGTRQHTPNGKGFHASDYCKHYIGEALECTGGEAIPF